MGTVPTVKSWADGEKPPYSDLQNVTAALEFLLSPPKVKLTQTSSQTVPTNTLTLFQWHAEELDTDSMHSTIINNTRITPQTPGIYKGWFMVSWNGVGSAADQTGERRAQLMKNGGFFYPLRQQRGPQTNGLDVSVGPQRFHVPMNGSTDYLEVMLFQSSGASMQTRISGAATSQFYMRWESAL